MKMNEHINIPVRTVRELLDSLHELLGDESKNELRSLNQDELALVSLFFGAHIRNTYIYFNPNKDELLKGVHPDDFTETIIKIFWEKLQDTKNN